MGTGNKDLRCVVMSFWLHVDPFALAKGAQLHDDTATLRCALVVLQEEQLLLVDSAVAMLANEDDSILRGHTTLNKGDGHQHGSAAKARHAVNGDGALAIAGERIFAQLQPFLPHVLRRRCAVLTGPIVHLDAFLLDGLHVVGWFAHSHKVLNFVLLELLDELRQRVIGRSVSDNKAQVLVVNGADMHAGLAGSSHCDGYQGVTRTR